MSRLRVPVAILAATCAWLMAAPGAATAGELVFKGCITGDRWLGPSGNGACAEIPSATRDARNSGLEPESIALSDGGASLYAGGGSSVASFDREVITGALSYRECLTGSEATGPSGSGACAKIPGATAFGMDSGLDFVVDAIVSGDGRSVYAVSDATVAQFQRDPTTGSLAYRGCITGKTSAGPSGSGACAAIPSATPSGDNSGLAGTGSLALSADGKTLYTVGFGWCERSHPDGTLICYGDDAVARFDRDPTSGDLTYRGCMTGESRSGPSGSGACAQIPSATAFGFNSGLTPRSVALDIHGDSLYAGGGGTVARFDRDPATGALTYRGCITGSEASGPSGSGACTEIPTATAKGAGSGLDGISSIVLSRNGGSLYAGAYSDSSVAQFDRDPATGALTYDGCLTGEDRSGPRGSGACARIPADARLAQLALSVDGGALYAAGKADVVQFGRDTATGALNYRDCITGYAQEARSDRGSCTEIPTATARFGWGSGLGSLSSLVGGPDGRSLYTAAAVDNAVARIAVAPQTRITRGPHGKTRKHRAVLKFRSGERSTFECKLTGRHVRRKLIHWRQCGSEILRRRGRERYRKLRSGKKVFRVRATDRAGTTDPTPKKRRWRIR